MDAASLSRRLKAARELAGGITVNQLASLVDKPRFGGKVIGSIERGERQAAPHELEWLAEAMSIPVGFLTDNEPFADQDGTVEERLAQLAGQLGADRQDREEHVGELKALIDSQARAIDQQAAALRAQAGVLGELTGAVKDLRETIARLQPAADRIEDVTQRADETSQRAAEIVQGIVARVEAGDLQVPAQSSETAASKKRPTRSRTA